MKRLKDKFEMKNADLAKRFGMSRSWITKLLSLNKLDKIDKMRVAKGDLTVTEAYRSTLPKSFSEQQDDYEPCDVCGKQAHWEDTRRFNLCADCRKALDKVSTQVEAKRRLRIE